MPVEREIKGQDHSLWGMGENQPGPTCRPEGWASTLPMLIWMGLGGGHRHVQGSTTGGHSNSGKAPQTTDLRPQAMPTDKLWRAGPQPPSPGQRCRGPGHSPKPAGGCWRGFGELSLGSGWPWPRPPTTPGCGARWDHRDGTHSSCGCPPVVIQDRAHRRHEESGCQEPQSLDTRIHGPPRGVDRGPELV